MIFNIMLIVFRSAFIYTIYSTITSWYVSDDKEKKKEIRERALLKYQEKLSSESIANAEKKHAERKYALETMMKVTYSVTTVYYIPLYFTAKQ